MKKRNDEIKTKIIFAFFFLLKMKNFKFFLINLNKKTR